MTRVLGTVAAAAARRFGDTPAVVLHASGGEVAEVRSLSYQQLDLVASDAAAGLARAGIGPGDVVAAVLPGGPEWVALAVAADRIGATWAPVSTALAAAERAALVDLVDPSVVVAGAEQVDGLPLRAPVVVVDPGGAGGDPVGGILPARQAGSRRRSGRRRRSGTGRAAVTTVCFTSGTTGLPRPAAFTVSQQRAVQRIDLGDRSRSWGGGGHMVCSTQLAHVGMALKLPWYLRTGSTLHVLPRWRADDVLELVARHRMVTLGVVAPQLALMLRSPRFDELDLSCVRTVVAGGAPSPPALVSEARRRLGADYSIRWSSTESGGVGLATAPDADTDEALHTVGRPRPGVQARVASEDDTPMGDGEVGELQLRSGAVMAGYLGDDPGGFDAGATRDALTDDGWLRTGDLAVRHPSGAYELAGRRTEMYLRGGYNVFPMEVESVLADHPLVADVAVVPRADEVMGEVGVAVVVPVEGARAPTLDELRSHAAARLARHKLPEHVVVTEALPLTGSQKRDRAALARLASGDRLDG